MAKLILIALALGAGLIASVIIRGAVRKHGLGKLIFRWLTGAHLDGVLRTDAGWLIRGTKVYTQTGRASAWAHKPRAHRAAWRGGGTLSVLGILVGLVLARTLTMVLATVALIALAAFGGWRAYEAIGEYGHTRRWVRPLHEALGRALGMPLGVSPRSWLTVPRDFAGREGAQIVVRLPEGYNNTGDESKRLIREIVSTKLALEHPSATWHLAGKAPYATFTVAVPPPAKVTYAEVRELMGAARDTAPMIGLGRGRKPVDADLDSDSPHILMSMGTGAGKSVLARLIIAQVLNRGGVALILDVKRLSHAWARGLPNVRYARDAGEIHDALLWLRVELDRRNRLADEGADIDGNTDSVDVGPRIIVVCEEMNATIQRLAAWWREIKEKDDPAQSPAVEALADAAFMGRQVLCNLLLIGQMITARAVGGPEIRENAGVRILGRYTVNNARMLVPEIYPFPKSSRKPGRVQVCIGGTAHETQSAFLTPAEARELASSGTVSAFPGTSGAEVQGHGGEIPVTGMRLHVARSAAPIGLREAASKGIVPVSLAALRSARARDPEFPEARDTTAAGEQLYDRDELAAWARNRPRAGTAEAVGE